MLRVFVVRPHATPFSRGAFSFLIYVYGSLFRVARVSWRRKMCAARQHKVAVCLTVVVCVLGHLGRLGVRKSCARWLAGYSCFRSARHLGICLAHIWTLLFTWHLVCQPRAHEAVFRFIFAITRGIFARNLCANTIIVSVTNVRVRFSNGNIQLFCFARSLRAHKGGTLYYEILHAEQEVRWAPNYIVK